MGKPAPRLSIPAVHYISKTVDYNSSEFVDGTYTAISTGLPIGAIPANSLITSIHVTVRTAFNAATTNVLTVGSNSSDYNNLVAAGDIDESQANSCLVLADGQYISTETTVYAKYTQTGTAATAGKATIVIQFCPGQE